MASVPRSESPSRPLSLPLFATSSTPMWPPPPGLFSTTTGCPHASCSFGAMMRARMSDAPPGVNGTMIREGGLAGDCAWAIPAWVSAVNARSAVKRRFVLIGPFLLAGAEPAGLHHPGKNPEDGRDGAQERPKPGVAQGYFALGRVRERLQGGKGGERDRDTDEREDRAHPHGDGGGDFHAADTTKENARRALACWALNHRASSTRWRRIRQSRVLRGSHARLTSGLLIPDDEWRFTTA